MKKLVLTAITACLAVGSTMAQDAVNELHCKGLSENVAKNLKNTENAKKALKSATWVSLGDAYLDLAQSCGEDSTATEKAESIYKKALEIENASGGKKSKDIEAALSGEKIAASYLMQGASFYNSKNYKKAAQYFGKSSTLNPKDTTSALYAGIAEQMIENNDGALTYLNRYITNGGKDASVYYSIAQIYKSQKQFDQAATVLKDGMKALPDNKDLPNELINVYLVSNNLEKAISDLEALVKADPKNTQNLTNLGLVYDSRAQEISNEVSKLNVKLQEGNTEKLDKKLLAEQDKLAAYEGEIASLNAKLKKDPKTAAATKKRIAEVTSQKGEIESEIATVIADIQKKKAANSNTDALKSQVSELATKQASIKAKASETYNKVLAVDPNNFDVLFNLAVMNYNDAVEIKKVVDHMDIATYRKEGKAVEDKACAQFAAAKPYFERASKIKPEDEGIKDNLSNLEKILEQCSK